MRFPLLLLVCCFLFSGTPLRAQLTKSAWLITESIGGPTFDGIAGGSNHLFGIQRSGSGPAGSFTWGVSPGVGYFLTDHWVLGAGLDFFTASFNQPGFGVETFTGLRVRPFVRYYVNPGRENFHYFVETVYDHTFDIDGGFFSRTDGEVALGVTYRINENVLLDGKAGYRLQDVNRFDFIGRNNTYRSSITSSIAVNILLDRPWQKRNQVTDGVGKGTLLTGIYGLSFTGRRGDNGVDPFFNFRGKALYFVTDRWAVGSGINYRWDRTSFESFNPITGVSYIRTASGGGVEVVPQARYYFTQLRHGRLFAAAGLSFQHGWNRVDPETATLFGLAEKTAGNNRYVHLGVGANFFLTPTIAFEVGPNFIHGGEERLNRFGLDAGLQVFFNRERED